MGQCAMARASYLGSTRAMALGTPPLAWFCAATWPVFAPPLTRVLTRSAGSEGKCACSSLCSLAAFSLSNVGMRIPPNFE